MGSVMGGLGAVIPWRVRRFVNDRFPVLYHLAAHRGVHLNSAARWDAEMAATWDDPNRDWPTKNILVRGLTRPDDRIIDLGCGSGSILRYLRGEGYRDLHGLEQSRYAVERLGRDGIAMLHGSLLDVPAPSQTFDVVIASEVLEHVIRRKRFLAEIARLLKPGGMALVFVPDACQSPMDEPEHVMTYDRATLAAFLGRRLVVERVDSFTDANHHLPTLFALARRPALPT